MNGGSTRLGCSMHHEYSTAVCVCVPVAHRFFFLLSTLTWWTRSGAISQRDRTTCVRASCHYVMMCKGRGFLSTQGRKKPRQSRRRWVQIFSVLLVGEEFALHGLRLARSA